MLSGDELRHRIAAPDLPGMLAEAPGVHVQKTGRWMGSPFIRGFTAFHNLILIDGIRLNNSLFRSGPNQYWGTIDPLMVERLELVYGPGSTLYGTDAVGGVVNLVTERFDPDAPSWSRFYTRGASSERSVIARYGDSIALSESTGIVWGTSVKHYDDLTAGDGTLLPATGYDQYAANARYTAFLDHALAVDFIFQLDFLDDGVRTHKTKFAVPFNGTSVGSDQVRQFDHWRLLTALQVTHDEPGLFYDRAKYSLSLHTQLEERFRIKSSGKQERVGSTLYQAGLDVQFENDLSDTNTLTTGFDLYVDRVNTYKRKLDAAGVITSIGIQGVVGDDSWYAIAGLFAQDRWDIGEQLALTAGVRLTYAHATSDGVEGSSGKITVSDNFLGAAGSLQFQYFADPDLQFYVDLSTAFRAPNLSDLTRLDQSQTNQLEQPAPGLNPELFYVGELGAKFDLASGLSGQARVWGAIIDGLITRIATGVFVGPDEIVEKRNIGDGWSYGFDLDLSYALNPHVSFSGTFSWLDAEIDTLATTTSPLTREPTSKMPPLRAQFGVRFFDRASVGEAAGFWTEFFVQLAGRQNRLSPNDKKDGSRIPVGGTPSWLTFNVRMSWEIAPGQTFSLALLNLTDRRYRLHGSGIDEPGFNAVATFELRW